MKTIKLSSWVNNYMCLLLSLYIILTQINFGNKLFVQSRSIDDSLSIDDEDFCQLQLHRRQYFTDPNPKTVKHNHKHLKIYQVKSIRTIGSCCWVFYRKRRFRGNAFFMMAGNFKISSLEKFFNSMRVRSVRKHNCNSVWNVRKTVVSEAKHVWVVVQQKSFFISAKGLFKGKFLFLNEPKWYKPSKTCCKRKQNSNLFISQYFKFYKFIWDKLHLWVIWNFHCGVIEFIMMLIADIMVKM